MLSQEASREAREVSVVLRSMEGEMPPEDRRYHPLGQISLSPSSCHNWLRKRISCSLCILHPQINHFKSIFEGFFVGISMSPATWKLWYAGNINVIPGVPLNENRVVMIIIHLSPSHH